MVRIFEKQKYITINKPNFGTVKKPIYRECSECGAFTKTSTKRLSYWDKYCFVCGVAF